MKLNILKSLHDNYKRTVGAKRRVSESFKSDLSKQHVRNYFMMNTPNLLEQAENIM
jgi:hypothetical protein